MHTAHYLDAGAYLNHGAVASLLPAEQLTATVYTHRDAERVLAGAPAERVVAVRPTGLASSYALTQRPLTAVALATLSAKERQVLAGETDIDIGTFEWLQIGRATTRSQNHSLAEY